MYAYLSWEKIVLQCLDTRVCEGGGGGRRGGGGGGMCPVPGWVHARVTMENPPYSPLTIFGGLHALFWPP